MAVFGYMERRLVAQLNVEANVTFVFRKSGFSLEPQVFSMYLIINGQNIRRFHPFLSNSVIIYYDPDWNEWRGLRVGS